ncbi:hypothetical protein [Campylobacter helveticus]|uniref:hypothetical protein n=1 Tax=Campylobacter helveticus TaxID=28898 RepID=UPI0009D7C6A1|nr:hypothetical protein [Campylobacter helveticus]MCR2057138.1 hypothetical protein [Campylobacter helveticus]MCR2060807.1 hypothetical protein [Campylobacter helveticus]QBL11566.1 hypothetical protein A0073_03245 [Campylobacter helveticus]TNB59643.1 hypothetical protein FDR72_07970 [Campylobacter helveticus]TXK53799.1 hypothetical protein A9726_05085 [Campylobacter helveticus]
MHKNPLRAKQIEEFAKHPPYDQFEMLPYLDEMMVVDWVVDFNMLYNYATDDGSATRSLYDKIKQGTLKDPRYQDSTPESRREFYKESGITLANNLCIITLIYQMNGARKRQNYI